MKQPQQRMSESLDDQDKRHGQDLRNDNQRQPQRSQRRLASSGGGDRRQLHRGVEGPGRWRRRRHRRWRLRAPLRRRRAAAGRLVPGRSLAHGVSPGCAPSATIDGHAGMAVRVPGKLHQKHLRRQAGERPDRVEAQVVLPSIRHPPRAGRDAAKKVAPSLHRHCPPDTKVAGVDFIPIPALERLLPEHHAAGFAGKVLSR